VVLRDRSGRWRSTRIKNDGHLPPLKRWPAALDKSSHTGASRKPGELQLLMDGHCQAQVLTGLELRRISDEGSRHSPRRSRRSRPRC